MIWTYWLIGALIVFLPGAYLFRSGKPKIIRFYALACALLIVAWVFNLGALLGPGLAHWPKMLLAMLAPGTLLLAIWGVQKDREKVMGTGADRDALATAAFLYGAGHHHASDAAGDLGDAGGGDA